MSRRQILRVVVVLAVVLGLFLVVPLDSLREFLDPDRLREQAAAGGGRFVLGFLGATVLLAGMTGQQALPAVAGATLFGPLVGPLLSVLGVSAGSALQFLGVRYAFREPAQALLSRRAPTLAAHLEARGLAVLVLLRFIWFPLFPTNLGAALSPLGLGRFLASCPAMLPQAFIWAFATDAIVTYGLADVPPERWGMLAAMVGAAVGGYALALRRWPELRAVGKGATSPEEPS